MKNLTPKDCLLCHSKRYNELLAFSEPDAYERAVGVGDEGYKRQWVKCRGCGFIYSRYSRGREVIEKIYQFSYRSYRAAWRNNEDVEQIFHRVTQLPETESETKFRVKWIKVHILELNKSGILKNRINVRKFLDIGGGNGIFAYEFQDEQWKLT